jgi:hypothetical protein
MIVPAPAASHNRSFMSLASTMPRLGGLPDLRTYDCKRCGVALTEAYEPIHAAGSLT